MDISRRLTDLGVEKLICGGIQNQNKAWLMGKGILVVDNQKGVAREIVRTHLNTIPD